MKLPVAATLRFATASEFQDWLAKRHASAAEAWLQLRRAGAPPPGITYGEALDAALCHGWIDGVRYAGEDARTFIVRFSPRKRASIWSKVNLRHYDRLDKAGLVAPAGRAAFEDRDPARSGLYSFETRPRKLSPAYRRTFQAAPKAWAFFMAQPPGYRRTAIFWVVSAKREPTRARRLAQLIRDSAAARRLSLLARPAGPEKRTFPSRHGGK